MNSRRFTNQAKKEPLQPLIDRKDNIVADLRNKLKLKNGEAHQQLDQFYDRVSKLPKLTSSQVTSKDLASFIFHFALLFKSIIALPALRCVIWTRESTLSIMEPVIDFYNEVQSRDYERSLLAVTIAL
jgi:hypothetical protein